MSNKPQWEKTPFKMEYHTHNQLIDQIERMALVVGEKDILLEKIELLHPDSEYKFIACGSSMKLRHDLNAVEAEYPYHEREYYSRNTLMPRIKMQINGFENTKENQKILNRFKEQAIKAGINKDQINELLPHFQYWVNQGMGPDGFLRGIIAIKEMK